MIVPVYIASFLKPLKDLDKMDNDESSITKIGTRMLWLGLSRFFVPFFKVFICLQPYVGMMLSLAIVQHLQKYTVVLNLILVLQ